MPTEGSADFGLSVSSVTVKGNMPDTDCSNDAVDSLLDCLVLFLKGEDIPNEQLQGLADPWSPPVGHSQAAHGRASAALVAPQAQLAKTNICSV